MSSKSNNTNNSCKGLCCCAILTIIVLGSTLPIIFIKFSFPSELQFTVIGASLSRFDFSADDHNNTLSYSLALNLTVRNPNKKGGVYFERFQVITEYKEETFGVATLAAAPFQLGPLNTKFVSAVLEGEQAIALDKEKDVRGYQSEAASRVFTIDVKIALRLRNVTFSKTKRYLEPSKIGCNRLKIPIRGTNNNDSSSMDFKATKCYDVYIFTRRPSNVTHHFQ